MRPAARREGCIVQEVEGETLVYDRQRDRAHCLSSSTALVWSWCDGRTGLPEMARRLSRATGLPADEGLVVLALQRLLRARLLEEPLSLPPTPTRRAIVKRLGLAAGLAALVPAMSSIDAPAAAQAATCRRACQICVRQSDCCAGCNCVTAAGGIKECRQVPGQQPCPSVC